MIRRLGTIVGLAACLGTVGGCDNFLEVEQTIQPESGSLFDNDEDFDTALGSAFGVWWGTAQGSRPTNGVQNWPVLGMANLGDELVMSLTTGTGHAYVAQEPRTSYDNDQFGGNWLFRKPFYDMYLCTAIAIDALRYLDANPERRILEEGVDDVTPRARWFARLMNGVCHVYAGLIFDQGYTVDESFDTQNPNQDHAGMLKPHSEVTAFGIEQLELAITEMEAAPNATIPAIWINRPETDLVTKADLIKFAHSMIARGLIYDARTPEQRALAEWDRAISHIDQGITEDFYVLGLSPRFDSRYKQYINFQNDGRISNRVVGPADTTGEYEAWEAAGLEGREHFLINTPDRRVHGVATSSLAAYKVPGEYFFLRYSSCSSSQRTARGETAAVCWNPVNASSSGGTYRRSLYASRKWGGATHYNTGDLVTISVKEMNFLRAEALLRDGLADEAAAMINAQGRVDIGELPPATATGSGTLPSCVPRKLYATTPTCGDLWDVLMYEKRIETHGVEAIIAFADWRGWGMMPQGTICQFAPPGRELELIGVPYYTFGGEWAGSVGNPARANGATCGEPLVGPLG
jgi:hypothetical protein